MDLRMRWHLELVDKASSRLLRNDRAIRTSIGQTERAQRRLASAALQGGEQATRASNRTITARRREGQVTASTTQEYRRLNRAQAEALSSSSRLASSAHRIASAYRTQARAAREASFAERTRARAARAGTAGTGAVAGVAAGVTRLRTAAIGVAAGGGAAALAIRTFAGFEQQMDRVQAVSGSTEKQLGRLEAQAIRLGERTSFSAKEAAAGMYQLSTAGFGAAQVMRSIPGTLDLAAASGVELADAAELQASALRGFGLRARDAGRVADALTQTVNASAVEMFDLGDSLKYVAPIARATGQSMESMLAAIGLMGNVGVKGAQAGTTLRTALVRLTDPTDKARNALADLGIDAGELRGPKGLLPLPAILDKVAKGSRGVDKGTRNAALAAIFGREALSGMVALVEQGPKALNRQIDALKASEGQAKRTAKTMRSNVAGAWDEFTGSLETAAITLTKRFSPALQDALKGGAELVNRGAKSGAGLLAGLTGESGIRSRRVRGPRGRVERVEVDESTAAQRAGTAIRGGLEAAGKGALSVGRQLLDALKPAAPFLHNVLLPLLKGVGKGVLISIVGAFKVAVPAIRLLATALGWIGEKAKPFRGIIEGVGVAIGFVFSGPILKGIGLLGKLGSVFKIIGPAAKLAAVPIRLVGAALGGALRVAGAVASRLAGPVVGGFRLVGRAAGAIGGVIRGAAGRVAGAVSGIVSAVRRPLATLAVNIYSAVRGGLDRTVGIIKGFGSTFLKAGRGLVGKLVDGVKGIGSAIVRAFGSGLSFAGDIGRALANWLNRSTPLGDKVNLPSPLPDFTLPSLRRGGRIGRYQDGGHVPILAAGGELLVDQGRAGVIPGDPRRDGTLLMARPGSAVLTASGQAMMAAGATLTQAIAGQAPHFARGGVVPGRYDSTAYGPPWTGINGTGVTRTGVNLRANPRLYGVAVDPDLIRLGAKPYVWPNPFGYSGRFSAFDTGSAIQGRRLDFYDWRGRARQLAWGHRGVNVDTRPIRRRGQGGRDTFTAPGGGGRPAAVRILRASQRRGGLLDDAFAQGIAAGSEGLTRKTIRAEGNPILKAIREQAGAAGPRGGGISQRYRPDSPSASRGVLGAIRRVASATRVPYVWGGGHGGFSRSPSGLDCSGYVSHVLHYGGANPGLGAPVTTEGTARYGRAGPGRNVTIHTRNGAQAHTLLTINGKGYSSGNRSTGRLSGAYSATAAYLASLPIKRHPVGLRAGGIIPRLRTGGGVGRALRGGVSRALDFRRGSLEALDELVGAAVGERLFALRAQLLRRVRAGGPSRVVKRLQSMLDVLDFELGRRIGRLQDRVSQRANTISRSSSAMDRFLRRRGIDAASPTGLGLQGMRAGATEIPLLRGNVRDLRGALRTARRRGDRGAVRELTGSLQAARDELDEALVTQIERRREVIRAIAAERVDSAQFGLDLSNAGLAALDAGQRVNRTAETPAGQRARSAAITSSLIPNLRALQAAQRGQLTAAQRTGDVAGARSAVLAISQTGTDLANAIADAADLLRDAAIKASQELVDVAAHRTTLATSGLQRLELEQRIAGTFETGGAERASFIRATILPALQAELITLRKQEQTFRAQGLTAELRQVLEAIAAKENERLQAIVDATEQTAENTDPRRFGGTTGFNFGNENLTDSLIAAGNGA
jgi:TP901 family phage tail tape measure protein